MATEIHVMAQEMILHAMCVTMMAATVQNTNLTAQQQTLLQQLRTTLKHMIQSL